MSHRLNIAINSLNATAFHRSQEPIAQMFAISRKLRQQGIKHYGFHGLSYK